MDQIPCSVHANPSNALVAEIAVAPSIPDKAHIFLVHLILLLPAPRQTHQRQRDCRYNRQYPKAGKQRGQEHVRIFDQGVHREQNAQPADGAKDDSDDFPVIFSVPKTILMIFLSYSPSIAAVQ